MKELIIDRMEGIYAICSDKKQKDKEQKFFGIQISELPQGTSVGDTVLVDDETGTLNVQKPEPKPKK